MISCEGFSGELLTIRKSDDTKISVEKIEEYARKIKELLSSANREGSIGRNIVGKLKQTGQLLYDELLPLRTKESLNNTIAENLVLGIDDHLMDIPWELLHDGQDFLCQRFNIGRVVSTRQDFSARHRNIDIPLRMLILTDPQDNLPSSYLEGLKLRDMLDEKENLAAVDLKSSNITCDYFKGNLKLYDCIHYAGHADYDPENPAESGFLLMDGKLTARNIKGMTGRTPFPSFIFSNACQSGQTAEWKVDKGYKNIFGLANAFLLAGVRHYIGTFREIQDKQSLHFALAFYEALMEGAPIGKALRLARLVSIEEFGEESVAWASYMLYGDPTFIYVHREAKTEIATPFAAKIPDEEKKAAECSILQGDEKRQAHGVQDKKNTYLVYISCIIFLAAVFVLLIKHFDKPFSINNGKFISKKSTMDQKQKNLTADDLVDALVIKYQHDNLSTPEKINALSTNSDNAQILRNIQENHIAGREKDFILGLIVDDLKNEERMTKIDQQILHKFMTVLELSDSGGQGQLTTEKLAKVLAARLTGSKIAWKGKKPAGMTPTDSAGKDSIIPRKVSGAGGSSDALIEVLEELSE